MAVSTDTIEAYFKQLDWPFQRRDEHNWSTGFKGDTYEFNFYVRTTDDWLYIYASFPVKVNAAATSNLHEHLLRLNYNMNMAKFMLDDDNDIGLTVEIPNSDLQVGEFEDALRAVCIYMDRNYVELVRLATDPKAVSSLKPAATPAATT